jgi:hypothetical protein
MHPLPPLDLAPGLQDEWLTKVLDAIHGNKKA